MMNHTVRLTGAILGEENKEEESSGEISSWTGRRDGPLLPPPPLIDRANIKDKGQPAATTAPLQQLNNSRTAMAAAATAPPPPRRLSSTEQKSGIDYFMTLKRSPVPSHPPSPLVMSSPSLCKKHKYCGQSQVPRPRAPSAGFDCFERGDVASSVTLSPSPSVPLSSVGQSRGY